MKGTDALEAKTIQSDGRKKGGEQEGQDAARENELDWQIYRKQGNREMDGGLAEWRKAL